MGVEEPMELRVERDRSRLRRKMMKTRTQRAAIARKPRTTMTAIAQWGKESLLPAITLPPEAVVVADEDERVAEDEADAAAAEDMEARTEVG
jgi:hypothetical protein